MWQIPFYDQMLTSNTIWFSETPEYRIQNLFGVAKKEYIIQRLLFGQYRFRWQNEVETVYGGFNSNFMGNVNFSSRMVSVWTASSFTFLRIGCDATSLSLQCLQCKGCFTNWFLIHYFSQSFFLEISSKHLYSQTLRVRDLAFWDNVHSPLCVIGKSWGASQ